MKKFKIEYLIYIFLILTPILDATSFIYRSYFPSSIISPTTLIRPLIPIILLIYIFIKDSKVRKYILIIAFIYIIYGIGHLYTFNCYYSAFNAGSYLSEAQYLFNYTYMIGLLYVIYYFYSRGKLVKLDKYLFIMLAIYLSLIYIAIVTNTSSTTYIDGVGYKGYNASGNGLSAIMILSFATTFSFIIKNIKKVYMWLFLIALFYFLIVLFGTKTALLGSLLVVCMYGFSLMVVYLITKKSFNTKKISLYAILLIVLICIAIFGGSNVYKRATNKEKDSSNVIDPFTKKESHMTGDLTNYVNKIKNNESLEMTKYQKKALLNTYNFLNKIKLNNSNRRIQQVIYHHNLFKEEFSLKVLLFGTGYLNNYSELTLEMETIALFYNFGILGVILYLFIFIYMTLSTIIRVFKNKKKVEVIDIMYILTMLLSILLSTITGYVFFYAGSMVVVSCIMVLGYNKEKLVGEKR